MVAPGAQPVLPARVAYGDRQPPVVARGDEMDGAPHQRPLDDLAPFEGAGQLVALEALHPRPQADVHRRCVLRLQPAHLLERAWQPAPATLEQQLAGEQSSIEVALRERSLCVRT